MPDNIRLSKVAKEYNISTREIVRFLANNGHLVRYNPNAKLSEEEYSLIANNYQKFDYELEKLPPKNVVISIDEEDLYKTDKGKDEKVNKPKKASPFIKTDKGKEEKVNKPKKASPSIKKLIKKRERKNIGNQYTDFFRTILQYTIDKCHSRVATNIEKKKKINPATIKAIIDGDLTETRSYHTVIHYCLRLLVQKAHIDGNNWNLNKITYTQFQVISRDIVGDDTPLSDYITAFEYIKGAIEDGRFKHAKKKQKIKSVSNNTNIVPNSALKKQTNNKEEKIQSGNSAPKNKPTTRRKKRQSGGGFKTHTINYYDNPYVSKKTVENTHDYEYGITDT